jgi:8-oxo-dGTP pyrophosphatase MutT (NUDIX family)
MSNWQRLDTKIVYQNAYITVHEDNVINPGAKPGIYGWVETPPAVFVVPIDDHGKVLLEKQLRYTTGLASWEVPAGSTDGEEPLAAAKRELAEETQLHAEKWEQLDGEVHPFNSLSPERNITFIARGLHKAKGHAREDDEAIVELKSFSWTELKRMIKSGEITDGQTITTLARAGLHLGHLK